MSIDAGAAAVVVGDATPATTDANAFTSVSVKDGSTVDVTDNSGAAAVVGSKLTTVSLNKNTGAATLTGDGINTVSVTSAVAASDVTVVNTKAHTLNLTVNTVATTVEVQDDEATAVVLTTTGLTADAKGSALSLDVGKATSITPSSAQAPPTSLSQSRKSLVTSAPTKLWSSTLLVRTTCTPKAPSMVSLVTKYWSS